MTDTKQDSGHGSARQKDKTAAKEHAADAKQGAGADDGTGGLRGRVDQVGALFAKSLDLAEAGLGLGVTLVSRVGVAAQQQIFDRFVNQAGAAADPTMAPFSPQPPPPTAEMAPAPAGHEPENFGIGNRLPLQPGGEVRVSFSINNDSLETPKKVALSLEGFIGDTHGRRLDAAGFMLKPARKIIAPMDFEKFVLEGVLPTKAPPDLYRGWVVVSSDAELRIPVSLTVSSL